tara:strand:- start:2581 stop:2850 length:270 start_codon:yes stop_codon:yes gene_type:complete
MTKNMMVKAVSDYFAEKGVEGMDLAEYKSQGSEVPVKDYMLRRAFGSWSRVLSVVKNRYPVSVTPVEVEEPKAAPKPKAEVKVEKEDVE